MQSTESKLWETLQESQGSEAKLYGKERDEKGNLQIKRLKRHTKFKKQIGRL